MQRASRAKTYNLHSPLNPPQITVSPGEIFTAETELCTGGWLNGPDDLWTPDKTCALNPTVCIAVEGAQPGDMLAVEILDIVPGSVGYTGFHKTTNPLASQIVERDWGLNTRTVRIEDGFVHWSERLRLPVHPMIGTLGTAPAEEALSNAKGGEHGGNMDIQEVCAGTTVYLPVEVPGALLHVGDAHALQGDGEICCSGGIECRAVVTLRVQLQKRPQGMECVRMENEAYLMTAVCGQSLDESFRLATSQLLSWIVERYGMQLDEAYLLMGQVMEARCTQFVNPTTSYLCKMPKWVFSE